MRGVFHRGAIGRGVGLPALVAIACMLTGCMNAPSPQARVAEARVTGVTPEGVAVEFVVEVEHEGELAVPLREAAYTLHAGETSVSARRSPEATLPPAGRVAFAIPAALPLAPGAAPPAELPYRLDLELVYFVNRPLARAFYDSRIYRPSVTVRQEGVLEVPAAGLPPTEAEGGDGA